MAGRRTSSQARAVEKSLVSLLVPPASMPVEVRQIWDEILNSVGPTHFHQADAGMLASYCVALHNLRAIEREMLMDPSDGATRRNYVAVGALALSMSGKLRLVPSTRSPRKDDHGHDPAEKPEEDSDGYYAGG